MADYTYSVANDTANGVAALDALEAEINASAIVTALDNLSTSGDTLICSFKDSLSGGDETILDGLIAAHTGVALEMPEPPIKLGGIKEPEGYRARLVCIANQSITKNTTTTIDWVIPQLQWQGVNKNCYFDGIQYYLADGEPGDSCTFQVVDKDGFGVAAGWYTQGQFDAMGNLYVVEEFGTDWALAPNSLEDLILYKARLYPGLYIRMKIISTGTTTDPYIVMNMYRHLDENS